MDDECAEKILRAKTLILGEVDESPEKALPVDVQPGKTFPVGPSCLKTVNPPDGEAPEPASLNMAKPFDQKLDLAAPAVEPAETQSLNNAEPSDQPAALATQPASAGASLPASSVEALAGMSGHQAKGAAGDDGPDKTENIANPASGQKDPIPTEDTLVQTPGATSGEKDPANEDTLGQPAGASAASEVDIDKIPSVTREAQQAFKNTIKPPKARGKPKKTAGEDGPKVEKPRAPAARMKRPAASKPPRQSKKARAEQEENPAMGDTRKKLDADFAAVADENGEGSAEPASGGRGEDEPGETVNKEPEKKPRQKRKRASTDSGEPGCRALPLTGLTSKNGEQRNTFAGRPAPKSLQANNRFTVMLTTYTSRIAPFIKKKASGVEAGCS